MAGLTVDGLEIKRLEDIKTELETFFQEAYGQINVSPESVLGQIIGINSRLLAELWELVEAVYFSQYVATAEGVALDQAVQLTGITRNPALPSVVVGQLKPNDPVTNEGLVINQGLQVNLSGTSDTFELSANTTLTKNNCHKAEYTVNSTTAGTYTITIDSTANSYVSAGGDTEAVIALNLSNAINSNLGTKVTASNNDAVVTVVIDTPESVSISFTADSTTANVDFDTFWTPATFTALVAGELPVPLNTLTDIQTPVTGLNEVDNLAPGTLGTDIESDAELRARQSDSLQIRGFATVEAIKARLEQEVDGVTSASVFENPTESVDGEGRPPHSIECVVLGGTDQAVGEKIWETKSAGIQTFSSNTPENFYDVTDSEGGIHRIYFTRPEQIEIYVVVDIIKDTDAGIYPTDGDLLIKNGIVSLGEGQELGQDVLIQTYFTPVYTVSGVYSAVLKMGTSPAPVGTTNIVIASNEIAVFDITRITVNDVTP